MVHCYGQQCHQPGVHNKANSKIQRRLLHCLDIISFSISCIVRTCRQRRSKRSYRIRGEGLPSFVADAGNSDRPAKFGFCLPFRAFYMQSHIAEWSCLHTVIYTSWLSRKSRAAAVCVQAACSASGHRATGDNSWAQTRGKSLSFVPCISKRCSCIVCPFYNGGCCSCECCPHVLGQKAVNPPHPHTE